MSISPHTSWVPSTSTKSTKYSSHPFNPGYTTHTSDTTNSWTVTVCSIVLLLLFLEPDSCT